MTMNTLQALQAKWNLKAWKLTAFLLPIALACLFSGDVMGHDIVTLFGYPVYPGAFLSLVALVIFNMIRTYQQNKLILFLFIVLAVVCNLIFYAFSEWVVSLPHPKFDYFQQSYQVIMPALWHEYLAKALLTIVFLLLDLSLFSFLFFKRKWWFVSASFCASVLIVSLGSLLVGFFAFHGIFKAHLYELMWTNLLRNIIVLFIYSLVSEPVIYWIHQYYFK